MIRKIKYYTQPCQQPDRRSTVNLKPWALDRARQMANEDQVPLVKVVTDAIMNEYNSRKDPLFRQEIGFSRQ